MRRAGITENLGDVMMDTSTEPETICEGDPVLIIIDNKRRFIAEARPGAVIYTDRGAVPLGQAIGMPYGSRLPLPGGRSAVLLRPMLDDLLLIGYARRSQVIYPKDLGYMVLVGGVGPGTRVAEAGVGSGFLTSVLAYLVGDEGRVYGFDVREDMLRTARRNLSRAGLLERVELALHDVREGIPVERVDAVFLDLPDPWNVVEHAYRVLRPSGRIVVFQPTVNQVEKTVASMRRHGGFIDIRTVEILLREYIVEEGRTRPYTRMIGHTGFITYARRALQPREKK